MTKQNVNSDKKVESPCVRNCCLNNEDICVGCFRHIDEIVGWRAMSVEKQQNILNLCQQRLLNSMTQAGSKKS